MQPNPASRHLRYREEGGAVLDVIQRLKERDEAALRLIIQQHGDYLLRTAYLLMKDRQSAEEAVQDTFITAYQKIDQLHDPQRLRSWLTQIAVNRCRMKQRTWNWRNLLPSSRVEELLEDEAVDSPLTQLLAASRNESLTQAIHLLDYKYREVITLFYYNELGVREIADQTGINENTIKARLSRGRSLLRILLAKEGITDATGERNDQPAIEG
jgi:RNA polymerase sigma factor (sigma-70 family)